MNLDDLVRYATLWSLIIAAFSVALAVFSHRRQVNASIYLDLTERLHKLYRALPNEIRAAQFAATSEESRGDPDQAAVIVVDFLHLMNAAFTLYRTGYFSGRLWKALDAEAKRGLRLAVFREQWPRTQSAFANNPGFIKYVERLQRT